MKKIILLVGLLLACLVTTWGNGITEGTIIDKELVEAHYETHYKSSTGLTTSGKLVIMQVPVQVWVEETYFLTYEGYTEDNKLKKRRVQVDKWVFDSYTLDAWFNEEEYK